jgi:hypothetical protein
MAVQFSVLRIGWEPSGFKEISRGVERSDTPDLRPLLNSTLKGVPPVGQWTQEWILFLGWG